MNARHRVFGRMWGVAVLAHLAGNWRHGDVWPDFTFLGLLLLAAGLVATAVVVRADRRLLLVLGGLIPVTAVLEAPVLGNHWLLAGFVSLGYLLTGGRWDSFEVAARVILVVFYSFAAFAKLNTGFLDPATSCGVFFANQWLESYGFGALSGQPIALATMWGSALIEVAVPVLLLIRRTRPWGAALAIGFHGIISLDLAQHFYDFTAVLLPLFAMFLPDAYFQRFERVGNLLRPAYRRLLAAVAVATGVAVTLASVTSLSPVSAWWLSIGSFLWWIPYLAFVVWSAVGALQPVSLSWKLGPVSALLGLLVLLNGLTPYLELKTAYGWNMYSNLVTVDGDSNHLLVGSTLPLRKGHRGLVRIQTSSDPGLQAYAEHGYLLPWPSFRSYLATHPGVSVTYERYGVSLEVTGASSDDMVAPVPWWWRWMPLRAVHQETPDRCQPGFLPAL